ncbi:hypothetical protein GCM10009535_54780 [Streptomyces thermocarboxydovorans]|uniref:Uncharacterized protein n=1 Tax=Streptomyces thermocarboxydovorans TaxID=59298 RepID=A0ABN1HUA7_9ACTN
MRRLYPAVRGHDNLPQVSRPQETGIRLGFGGVRALCSSRVRNLWVLGGLNSAVSDGCCSGERGVDGRSAPAEGPGVSPVATGPVPDLVRPDDRRVTVRSGDRQATVWSGDGAVG